MSAGTMWLLIRLKPSQRAPDVMFSGSFFINATTSAGVGQVPCAAPSAHRSLDSISALMLPCSSRVVLHSSYSVCTATSRLVASLNCRNTHSGTQVSAVLDCEVANAEDALLVLCEVLNVGSIRTGMVGSRTTNIFDNNLSRFLFAISARTHRAYTYT